LSEGCIRSDTRDAKEQDEDSKKDFHDFPLAATSRGAAATPSRYLVAHYTLQKQSAMWLPVAPSCSNQCPDS
jgi:hypothetical protein